MWTNKFVLAVAVFGLSTPALGQNLYNDIQREFADENQLQRDLRRYQYDIAAGNYLRAATDRARIQNDEANIRFDQAVVQNDLAYQGGAYAGQSLIPHPQYPGYYYYPSQPGQLYYYQTPQPTQAQASVPTNFVGPPNPNAYIGQATQPSYAAAANVAPTNPVTFNIAPPLRTITVLVSNPADTGVPINFAVDGTAYNVPSGYTQQLTATTSSIVEFDRGELFGDGRYSLSDGSYEFRYTTDKGWELYKRPTKPAVPTTASTSGLPRNVAPRSVASVATASPTAPTPTVTTPPQPTPDVVPPPPTPSSSLPR